MARVTSALWSALPSWLLGAASMYAAVILAAGRRTDASIWVSMGFGLLGLGALAQGAGRAHKAFVESYCTLCGKGVAECARLIGGKSGSVCGNCIIASVAALDDGRPTPSALVAATSQYFCEHAGKLPHSTRMALAEVLVEIGGGVLHAEVDAAMTLSDPAVALVLLRGVPPELRRNTDCANLLWALACCGLFDEACATWDGGTPDDSNLGKVIDLCLQNVIWARAHLSDGRTADQVRTDVARLEDIRQRLSDTYLVSSNWGVLAKCHMRLGDDHAAMACIRKAEATECGLRPGAAMLKGDLVASSGKGSEAVEIWTAARAAIDAVSEPYLWAQLDARLADHAE